MSPAEVEICRNKFADKKKVTFVAPVTQKKRTNLTRKT